MTDRDSCNRIGLCCLILSLTLGASAATGDAAAEPQAEIRSTPADTLQTRRYRFKLLPLETGDQYVLLA